MPETVFPAPGAGSGSVNWNGYSNTVVVSSSATTVTLSSGKTSIGWIGATPVKNSGTGQFANNTVITSVPYTTTFAGSFSGSGQYLTVPSTGTNAAFTFASDFTVEGWFYPTIITGSDRAIFCLGTETTNRYVWYIRNGGGIASNLFGTGTITYSVPTPVNTWTHIAIVRSGSTVSVYINGVVSSTTDTQAGTIGNGVLKIGSDSGGAAVFQGFISNFRVSSVAVYGSGTGAFTGRFNTATTTLTSTQLANVNGYPSSTITGTQTSVLTCQSATIIDNGTANGGAGFTISNTGPVTVSSTTIPPLITPGSTFNVNIAPTVTLSSANISIVSNQIHRVDDQSTVAGKLASTRVYKGLPTSSLPAVSTLQKQLEVVRSIPGEDYKFDTSTIQKPIQIIRGIQGDGYQFKLFSFFDRFKLPSTSTQLFESPLSSNLQKQIAVIKQAGQLYNNYRLSNFDSSYYSYFNNVNRIAVGVANPKYTFSGSPATKTTNGANTVLTFSTASLTTTPRAGEYLLITDTTTTNQSLVEIVTSTVVSTTITITFLTTSVSNLNISNTWTVQLWDPEILTQANVLTNTAPTNARERYYYSLLAKGLYGLQFPSQNNLTMLANNIQANSLTKQIEVIKSPVQVPNNYNLSNFDAPYTYFNDTNKVAVGTYNSKLYNYSTISSKATVGANTALTIGNTSSTISFITSGQTYYGAFNGTTQYLSMAQTVGAITNGPFTIEAWVYPTSLANGPFVVEDTYWNTGANGGWFFGINTSGTLQFGYSTATANAYSNLSSTISTTTNVWSHIAAVRDTNNLINLYINGQLANTPTVLTQSLNRDSGGTQTNWNTRIGAHIATGAVTNGFAGNITNVRIVPNKAVYTGPFIPIGPLGTRQPSRQNVLGLGGTETSLLALQTSTVTTDSSINNATITNVGSIAAPTLSQALGTVPRVSDYVLITDTVTNKQSLSQITAVTSNASPSITITIPSASISNLDSSNTWAYSLWEVDILQQTNVLTNTAPTNARESYYYSLLAQGRYGLRFPFESPATIPSLISVDKVTDTILQSTVSTTLAPANARERYYYALLARGRYGVNFPYESPGEPVNLGSVSKIEKTKIFNNQIFDSPLMNRLSIIDSAYWYDKTNLIDAIAGITSQKYVNLLGVTSGITVESTTTTATFSTTVYYPNYAPQPTAGDYVLLTDQNTGFQAIAPIASITYNLSLNVSVPIGQALMIGNGTSVGTGITATGAVGNQYSFTWTCPENVYSVATVAVGSGAGGGGYGQTGSGGGALVWANSITVVPGRTYNITAGTSGTLNTSGASSTVTFGSAVITANGGTFGGAGGSYSVSGVADSNYGGGTGGAGAAGSSGQSGGGGGGAAGYGGNGGNGGIGIYNTTGGSGGAGGSPGTGGGGGGGGGSGTYGSATGGGGGGVGVLGVGSSGVGGTAGPANGGPGGGGGGSNGTGFSVPAGGAYGGGGGGNGGAGGPGAVRIIWPALRLSDNSIYRSFGATSSVLATDQSGTLDEPRAQYSIILENSYLTNLNPANVWTVELWDPEIITQGLIRTNTPPVTPLENLYYASNFPGKYGLVYNINSISDASEILYDKKTDGLIVKFRTADLGQGVQDPTFTPKAPIQFWS